MGDVRLQDHIRSIPDFPREGILFRDIAPLLADPGAFSESIERLVRRYRKAGIERVLGIESRGFLFGAPLALQLGVGFVPVRKAGKLPGATLRRSYALEYGEAELEIQVDALSAGQRVLILDDLLATGGTAAAAAGLAEEAGAKVEELVFIVELTELGGRERLSWPVHSLLRYGAAGEVQEPQ